MGKVNDINVKIGSARLFLKEPPVLLQGADNAGRDRLAGSTRSHRNAALASSPRGVVNDRASRSIVVGSVKLADCL